MLKFLTLLFALFYVNQAFAAGSIIVAAIAGSAFAATAAGVAIAFAINMVVSAVISKAFFSPKQGSDYSGNLAGNSPNPGNRLQVAPATDNKLPIVYGKAFVGGTIVDLSITDNNQTLYYVVAICEVTNTNAGQTADNITFGNVYWGGKKCLFQPSRSYTYLGATVSYSSGNIVGFSDPLNQAIGAGDRITFIDFGSPAIYTVQSVDYDNFTITFTSTVSVPDGYGIFLFVENVGNNFEVYGLLDESTGVVDSTVAGKLGIMLYSNGSYKPYNTTENAISVMNWAGLTYKWDTNKLMSNCAFAIIRIQYSQTANLRGIEQTKFEVINSRNETGACLLDFMTSTRYGASLPLDQINTASLTALTAYSNESFPYVPAGGGIAYQKRFEFNGVLDTSRSVLDNMQDMASCCDSLIKFNEVTGQWGVIVQKPVYTAVMDINDSNMISTIEITPMDIAASYNVAEIKFPDKSQQDAFASSTFDLRQIAPELLYPNEPVNKVSVALPLVNNNVTAQYIGHRILKAAREDLQINVQITYVGIQLDAGDVVTVTNANYGWSAKPFRVVKVVQTFLEDGSIIVKLNLTEYNPDVYSDVYLQEFEPSDNTGIGDPQFFGTVYPPQIGTSNPFAADPFFTIQVETSTAGITQYAEIWYSAYQYPSTSQLFFAGTTAVQSSGNPYNPSSIISPNTVFANFPKGDWYFFCRMVNSIASSVFSTASPVLRWRPQTYQFQDRYLWVAYGTSNTGAGFSLNPRGKTYYGIKNSSTATPSLVPSDYSWYEATPEPFGTDNYVLFANRGNRKVSLSVDNAVTLGIGGAFVPSESSVYDQTQWGGLEDGINIIDLDSRSGQLTKVGTTSVSSADGLLSVTNNTNGTMVVALQKFLNFGSGVYSKTFSPAKVTIDVYGRVVGFVEQDDFYYTESEITATAGQTSFSITHVVGQVLVFRNGVLQSDTDYTETSSTVVLNNACAAGEQMSFVSMRAISKDDFYADSFLTVASFTSNSVTYTGLPYQEIVVGDKMTFSNTGTPTVYTVSAVDTTTKVITFTTSITVVAGARIYEYRAAGTDYPPYSRFEVDVTNLGSYTPTEFAINNGFEQIFLNGSAFNEIDYDLVDGVLTGFPSNITGRLILIVYEQNNLGVPCSNIVNTIGYSVAGQTTYPFPNNPLAFEIYANGVFYTQGSTLDYTASATSYTLNTAIPNNFTLLNQQTFGRTGAA